MDRILGYYPFFTAVCAIAIMMVLVVFNMYLLARHKKSLASIVVHIVSAFVTAGVIFYMIGTALFVLPEADSYMHLAGFAFFTSLLCGVTGAVVLAVIGKKHTMRNLPQNIPQAFKNIEALVFVIGQDGMISHINHDKKYRDYFGDIDTIDGMLAYLNEHCESGKKLPKDLDALQNNTSCELILPESSTSVQISVQPVYYREHFLGYTAVIEDITSVRQTEKDLEEQNEILELANSRLARYIKDAGALEAEKERLMILDKLQQTLIADIEQSLQQMSDMKQHAFDDHTYRYMMKELAADLRKIYDKVRSTVGQISGKDVKT